MQHSTLHLMEQTSLDLLVSTLDKGATRHGSQDHWGNALVETKPLETVCIVFQNMAGLSKNKEVGEMKLDIAQQRITQNKIDIFACMELGTCWDLEDYQQHLLQKTQAWWEASHWSLRYS